MVTLFVAQSCGLESRALEGVTWAARLEIGRGVHRIVCKLHALCLNAARLDLSVAQFHNLVHELAAVLNWARATLSLRDRALLATSVEASVDGRKFTSVHALSSCVDHVEAALDFRCELGRADLINHLFRFSFVHVSLFIRVV